MTFQNYCHLVNSDIFRIYGKSGFGLFFKNLFFSDGVSYCIWMRTCTFLQARFISKVLFYPFARFFLSHYKYKLGISISHDTQIGPGFYIGHYGSIVVSPNVVIGKNCNISHDVTLGQSNRGRRKGVPVIGDNVYIGPGAKVFGKITIGNHVAIGANCVVTKDVPDHAVVVGVPGTVKSLDGSRDYINNTVS